MVDTKIIKQKSMIEIIDETIKYYSEDVSKRAVIGDKCQYRTSDGRFCAVGRCFDENNPHVPFFYEGPAWAFSEVYIIDDYLKEEYRGRPIDFWGELQSLHDNSDHWDDNGITPEGLDYVDHLKRTYAD